MVFTSKSTPECGEVDVYVGESFISVHGFSNRGYTVASFSAG